jgi:hypothetical protein
VTGHQGLDDIDDLLLLMAGQLADGLEDATGFARRAIAALLGGGDTEQIICAAAESDRQGGELFGLEGNGLAFPIGNDTLRGSDFTGQFLLSESDSEAGCGDTFAQRRAGLGWRSSHWHIPSISDGRGDIRKGLHVYTKYR